MFFYLGASFNPLLRPLRDRFLDNRDHDEVEIIQEEKSPTVNTSQISFSCSGGGAAGYFYFNANQVKAGEELDQLDGLMGKHKDWKAFFDIKLRDRRRKP